MESIQEKLNNLPPELKTEVNDFIDFLLKKMKRRPRKKLKLDWAGGLKEFKHKFTSLDLQKNIIEWWGD
jgi:hypothetical protein